MSKLGAHMVKYQTLAICRLSLIKNRPKCDTHHYIIHNFTEN